MLPARNMLAHQLIERVHAQNKEFFSGLERSLLSAGVIQEPAFAEFGGTIAFFAGDPSPLTQASGRFCPEEFEQAEEFFRGKTSNWEAILTPYSDPETLEILHARNAQPEGWESILIRPLSKPVEELRSERIRVEEVDAGLLPTWRELSIKAFFGDSAEQSQVELFRRLELDGNSRKYIGYYDRIPAAVGSMTPAGEAGIAALGGMATLPEYRGRGLQTALIHHRLKDAAGAEFATMGANPTSASHRNAERAGFRVLCTELSFRVRY